MHRKSVRYPVAGVIIAAMFSGCSFENERTLPPTDGPCVVRTNAKGADVKSCPTIGPGVRRTKVNNQDVSPYPTIGPGVKRTKVDGADVRPYPIDVDTYLENFRRRE
jgi:hypothetical protein